MDIAVRILIAVGLLMFSGFILKTYVRIAEEHRESSELLDVLCAKVSFKFLLFVISLIIIPAGFAIYLLVDIILMCVN